MSFARPGSVPSKPLPKKKSTSENTIRLDSNFWKTQQIQNSSSSKSSDADVSSSDNDDSSSSNSRRVLRRNEYFSSDDDDDDDNRRSKRKRISKSHKKRSSSKKNTTLSKIRTEPSSPKLVQVEDESTIVKIEKSTPPSGKNTSTSKSSTTVTEDAIDLDQQVFHPLPVPISDANNSFTVPTNSSLPATPANSSNLSNLSNSNVATPLPLTPHISATPSSTVADYIPSTPQFMNSLHLPSNEELQDTLSEAESHDFSETDFSENDFQRPRTPPSVVPFSPFVSPPLATPHPPHNSNVTFQPNVVLPPNDSSVPSYFHHIQLHPQQLYTSDSSFDTTNCVGSSHQQQHNLPPTSHLSNDATGGASTNNNNNNNNVVPISLSIGRKLSGLDRSIQRKSIDVPNQFMDCVSKVFLNLFTLRPERIPFWENNGVEWPDPIKSCLPNLLKAITKVAFNPCMEFLDDSFAKDPDPKKRYLHQQAKSDQDFVDRIRNQMFLFGFRVRTKWSVSQADKYSLPASYRINPNNQNKNPRRRRQKRSKKNPIPPTPKSPYLNDFNNNSDIVNNNNIYSDSDAESLLVNSSSSNLSSIPHIFQPFSQDSFRNSNAANIAASSSSSSHQQRLPPTSNPDLYEILNESENDLSTFADSSSSSRNTSSSGGDLQHQLFYHSSLIPPELHYRDLIKSSATGSTGSTGSTGGVDLSRTDLQHPTVTIVGGVDSSSTTPNTVNNPTCSENESDTDAGFSDIEGLNKILGIDMDSLDPDSFNNEVARFFELSENDNLPPHSHQHQHHNLRFAYQSDDDTDDTGFGSDSAPED